jgi:cAMP phosphodiesterase
MSLDTFYAYANEAPSIALNRKSQQAPIMQPPSIDKTNAARNTLISAAMNDTNKCYHLFQHSLASYLVLIGVLNHVSCVVFSSAKDDEDAMVIDPKPVHDISAVREKDRKVLQSLF